MLLPVVVNFIDRHHVVVCRTSSSLEIYKVVWKLNCYFVERERPELLKWTKLKRNIIPSIVAYIESAGVNFERLLNNLAFAL